MVDRTLSIDQARRVYNRIGRHQDTQGIYENAALDRLVATARFREANRVVEFGCGTGAFALRLLRDEMPLKGRYNGFDLSPTMVHIARERLAPFSARASVSQTDGSPHLPLGEGMCDRFVTNYVLDLLAERLIRGVLGEAHRLLRSGGLLCAVSLTRGCTFSSKTLMALWNSVRRLAPVLVGGCRPIRIEDYLPSEEWQILVADTVISWGVPSEVLVARRLPAPGDEAA
jgi:ubiquinone/menaquinone biosynthesis C-methylase UbiE